MDKKHYVLQGRHFPHSNNWETLYCKYDTYEEAEAARLRLPAPNTYRVAESYTVVRYKAVKVKTH